MPLDDYVGDPCPTPSLNQSIIPAMLERSPWHAAFQHPRLNPYGSARESAKAQILGSAKHRIALGKGREISPIRYPDYRSLAAREARDLAVANKRLPVLERDYVDALACSKAAKALIAEVCGKRPWYPEVVVLWEERTQHGPVWCRAQLDLYCPDWQPDVDLIGDLKFLRIPATAEAFGRASSQSGYDVQGKFYPRGVEMCRPGKRVKFLNMVIENDAPHGSGCFEPDAGTLYTAEVQVAKAMELWAKCVHTRSWPGYPKGIQSYTTPGYFQNKVINS